MIAVNRRSIGNKRNYEIKKPVFAAKYHSRTQTCDKRILSPGKGAIENTTLFGWGCYTSC